MVEAGGRNYLIDADGKRFGDELKRIGWEGTEHWDQLLEERAEISGRLVLSEYTKETLKRFAER